MTVEHCPRVGTTLWQVRRRNLFIQTLCAFIALAVLNVNAAVAKNPVVQVGKNLVKVEVASTPDQIQRGLMYRTSLPEDHGMIFLFRPASGVRFWMAHCFISLDMVMIKDGHVVHIFENVPPCKASNEADCPTYPAADQPEILVDEVLEVNAGYAKRHGIKVGDAVKFTLGSKQAAVSNSKDGEAGQKQTSAETTATPVGAGTKH